MNSTARRWLIVFIFWAGLAGLAAAHPFDLSRAAYSVIIGFIAAMPLFILSPGGLPLAASALMMLGVFFVGGVPTPAIFSGFTGNAFWTLLPALLFGYVLTKTGLGRRLALYIISIFKPTPGGIALAWLSIGLVLSALTPSATLRTSIMMPMVLSLISTMKLKARSKEATYIALLAFVGATIPGNGWFTGTLAGPVTYGMLPPEIARTVTWTSYSKGLIVPFILITLILLAYIMLWKRPRSFAWSPEAIKTELTGLGPMSRNEKISLTVLIAAFLMFVTIPLHNLSTVPICIAAAFILFCLRVLELPDFSRGVNWGTVLFMGAMMSMPAVLSATGIITWLSPTIKTMFAPIAGNIFLFIAVMTCGVYLIRFVDVAFGMATQAVVLSFAVVLQQDFNIPITLLMTLSAAAQAFFCLHYMSPLALVGNDLIQGQGWAESDLAKLGLVFFIASIAAICISVFYWRAVGLA